MNIAICLSGEPRYIHYTYKKILTLFPYSNVDIFFHFWNAPPSSMFINSEYVIDLLSPKKYIYEDYKDWRKYKIIKQNVWSLSYSIMKANELKKEYEKENNIKYNYVLRTRSDMYYNRNLNYLIDIIKNVDLLIPYHTHFPYKNSFINDMVAFGTSDNIDYYSNFHNYMIENYDDHKKQNVHEILGEYLSKNDKIKIKIKKFYCFLIKEKFISGKLLEELIYHWDNLDKLISMNVLWTDKFYKHYRLYYLNNYDHKKIQNFLNSSLEN